MHTFVYFGPMHFYNPSDDYRSNDPDQHILLKELQCFSDFREQDFPDFLKLFKTFTIKKNAYFYQAGEVPQYSPFIVKGCMRKFMINEEGNEQIVFLAEEGWWAGEVHCMRNGTPTNMYLQALEDCEIAGMPVWNIDKALKEFPAYAQYFAIRYPLSHNKLLEEGLWLKTESPESLYRSLLAERPSLLLRVPHQHIATYLGMRPETLSRVRKKITAGA